METLFRFLFFSNLWMSQEGFDDKRMGILWRYRLLASFKHSLPRIYNSSFHFWSSSVFIHGMNEKTILPSLWKKSFQANASISSTFCEGNALVFLDWTSEADKFIMQAAQAIISSSSALENSFSTSTWIYEFLCSGLVLKHRQCFETTCSHFRLLLSISVDSKVNVCEHSLWEQLWNLTRLHATNKWYTSGSRLKFVYSVSNVPFYISFWKLSKPLAVACRNEIKIARLETLDSTQYPAVEDGN